MGWVGVRCGERMGGVCRELGGGRAATPIANYFLSKYFLSKYFLFKYFLSKYFLSKYFLSKNWEGRTRLAFRSIAFKRFRGSVPSFKCELNTSGTSCWKPVKEVGFEIKRLAKL